MKRTIINFCPTGMVPLKSQNASVPISPQEIIEQVHEATEMGITIAHLHARDENQKPAWQIEIYRDIIEGVRKYCPGLIVCASTSGRSFQDFEKRSAVIELKPDMCSLTLSSLNFPKQASVSSPELIVRLAEKMNNYGVKPELECFDLGMINYGNYLAEKGILKPPFYWNLIFGNVAGFQPDFIQMGAAVHSIKSEMNYIVFGGIGTCQLKTVSIAIASGYGVRIGLEDNLWFDYEKRVPATNALLLKRVHELMQINETKLVTSHEFGKTGFYNATENYIGV